MCGEDVEEWALCWMKIGLCLVIFAHSVELKSRKRCSASLPDSSTLGSSSIPLSPVGQTELVIKGISIKVARGFAWP